MVSLIVNIISKMKISIITLSICSLLFHPIRRYAVFFRLVEVFSAINLISAQMTTICNQSMPVPKNHILFASTASSSCKRKNGNTNINTISIHTYHRKICCSLLRCIHQRRTSSIRRFMCARKLKCQIYVHY